MLVFGNPIVSKDSIPLKIIGGLAARLPYIEFVEFDPNENLEDEGRELNIIDTVDGAKKVVLITDIGMIRTSKLYSMHDFDLGYSLKLLKKLGYIDRVRIFGVPMRIKQRDALEQLVTLIGANLP